MRRLVSTFQRQPPAAPDATRQLQRSQIWRPMHVPYRGSLKRLDHNLCHYMKSTSYATFRAHTNLRAASLSIAILSNVLRYRARMVQRARFTYNPAAHFDMTKFKRKLGHK